MPYSVSPDAKCGPKRLCLGLGFLPCSVSPDAKSGKGTLARAWWERGKMPYSVSPDAKCGVDPRQWEAPCEALTQSLMWSLTR